MHASLHALCFMVHGFMVQVQVEKRVVTLMHCYSEHDKNRRHSFRLTVNILILCSYSISNRTMNNNNNKTSKFLKIYFIKRRAQLSPFLCSQQCQQCQQDNPVPCWPKTFVVWKRNVNEITNEWANNNNKKNVPPQCRYFRHVLMFIMFFVWVCINFLLHLAFDYDQQYSTQESLPNEA